MVKNLPANAGDSGLIPGLGRSPGEENGYPLQCSCLENSMDRGTAKNWVNSETKERETGKLSAREISNSDDGTPNLVSPKRNTLRGCSPYTTINCVKSRLLITHHRIKSSLYLCLIKCSLLLPYLAQALKNGNKKELWKFRTKGNFFFPSWCSDFVKK